MKYAHSSLSFFPSLGIDTTSCFTVAIWCVFLRFLPIFFGLDENWTFAAEKSSKTGKYQLISPVFSRFMRRSKNLCRGLALWKEKNTKRRGMR